MRIQGKDLIEGIKKAKGVVDESSVIEHLRGFTFHPRENGLLDIAGSDGRLTMLAQVPYEDTEDSDLSMLVLDSDKLQQLVKYIGATSEVVFKYTSDTSEVEILVDKYRLKTHKKDTEYDLGLIDFNIIDEKDFDDELDVSEFIFVLESLLPLSQKDSPDLMNQTIFFDTSHAYLFDGSLVGRIAYKTNKPYVIEQRLAKQILILAKSTPDETIKLKQLEEGYEILLRTETDILTFKVSDPDVHDIDFINDFKLTTSFQVNRVDIVNSILRTKLATEEDEIYLTLDKDILNLKGISESGEQATDKIDIENYKGDPLKGEIDLLADNYVKLSGTMRTKEVIVSIDRDGNYLKIEDTQGRAMALMTVDIS